MDLVADPNRATHPAYILTLADRVARSRQPATVTLHTGGDTLTLHRVLESNYCTGQIHYLPTGGTDPKTIDVWEIASISV